MNEKNEEGFEEEIKKKRKKKKSNDKGVKKSLIYLQVHSRKEKEK